MARIHAFLQLDPHRIAEQMTFLQSRVTVLREVGGQYWVEMDEAQVETFINESFTVNIDEDALLLELGPLVYKPATEIPAVPENLRASPPNGEDNAFWIVHFIAPMDKSWLRALAELETEQVHVLNASAGVFRMT